MDESLKSGTGYLSFFKRIPIASLFIGGFFVILLVIGYFLGFSVANLLSDSIQRFGMWGLLVLAMVPSIQSGVGPNFALPVGVCGGLLALVITINLSFTAWPLLLISSVLALVIGSVLGFVYGVLMNKVKGSEMAIATYTGFSVTFLFSVIWVLFPVRSEYIGFFLGDGVRHMISLEPFAAQGLLENLWQFSVGGFTISTGTLLVVSAAGVIIWLFFRSKTGISISAAGMNPVFAGAAGLNVNQLRVIGNIISTALGAVGIVIYAQGFGFIQLYDFPLWLGFSAVAAVLVGGASAQRAKVMNVIIGAFLFQALITVGPTVFGRLLEGTGGDISDAVRQVIQNGVILYALMRLKGDGGV